MFAQPEQQIDRPRLASCYPHPHLSHSTALIVSSSLYFTIASLHRCICHTGMYILTLPEQSRVLPLSPVPLSSNQAFQQQKTGGYETSAYLPQASP